MNPPVSVLIATHNRPELLAQALASVEAQTYPHWDIVLVDDGSMPPVDLASCPPTLAQRITLLRHDHAQGSGAARNTAIRHARGEILAFLDDDDLLAPDFVARAVGALQGHPELDMICIGVSWFGRHAEAARDECGHSTLRFLQEAQGVRAPDGVLVFGAGLLPAIVRRVPMALQQQVLRREAAVRLGPFVEGRILDRSDWAIRAALYLQVGLVEEGLYLQRCDGQSYASRSDRHVEFLWAGVDLIDRLNARARGERHQPECHRVLRRAAAKSWFDLAYYLACRGEIATPARALLASQQRWFEPRRLRMLGRLMLNAVRSGSAS